MRCRALLFMAQCRFIQPTLQSLPRHDVMKPTSHLPTLFPWFEAPRISFHGGRVLVALGFFSCIVADSLGQVPSSSAQFRQCMDAAYIRLQSAYTSRADCVHVWRSMRAWHALMKEKDEDQRRKHIGSNRLLLSSRTQAAESDVS